MKALRASANWLDKAIAALKSPASWSPQTKHLLASLFHGGLQTSSERDALRTQLTHTLDGIEKFIESDASTIASAKLADAASCPRPAESTQLVDPADPTHPNRLDEMHISDAWLREATDVDLAATVVHEASHIYANTSDHWYNDKLTGSSPGFSQRITAARSPITEATFTNEVNNASTVQFAVEALAEIPYDSMRA